jgi:hypothetical protein
MITTTASRGIILNINLIILTHFSLLTPHEQQPLLERKFINQFVVNHVCFGDVVLHFFEPRVNCVVAHSIVVMASRVLTASLTVKHIKLVRTCLLCIELILAHSFVVIRRRSKVLLRIKTIWIIILVKSLEVGI